MDDIYELHQATMVVVRVFASHKKGPPLDLMASVAEKLKAEETLIWDVFVHTGEEDEVPEIRVYSSYLPFYDDPDMEVREYLSDYHARFDSALGLVAEYDDLSETQKGSLPENLRDAIALLDKACFAYMKHD